MKKLMSIAATLMLMIAATGCGPDEPIEEVIDITGQWQMSSFSTKVSIGNEQVDVYICFMEDKTFDMYQLVGAGRYRHFSGTWNLTDKVLSGKYSNSSMWASDYDVEMGSGNSQMILTTRGGSQTEVITYRKQTIPEDIKNNAEEGI